jgi:hypothetical protein
MECRVSTISHVSYFRIDFAHSHGRVAARARARRARYVSTGRKIPVRGPTDFIIARVSAMSR